jgi:hypothetical protein
VIELLKLLRLVMQFFQDNPELLELLKRLFGRSAAGQALTLDVVAEEVGAVQQLRATGGLSASPATQPAKAPKSKP